MPPDTSAPRRFAVLKPLKVILKGYNPTVPVEFVGSNLGFDDASDAAFFLEDHGCVLVPPGEKANVDCKASRASLVEHSIAAKEEEARKDAQRKAEIIPILGFS